MEQQELRIGIDVGSTTVKLAVLDEANQVRYSVYRRHHADVRARWSRCWRRLRRTLVRRP